MEIKVIGAIANKDGAVLYLSNGEEMNLSSSNYQTAKILQTLSKPLARRKEVVINLEDFSVFAQVEKKTSGRVRFFVDRAKKWFGIGPKPQPKVPQGLLGVQSKTSEDTVVAVVGDTLIPGMEKIERQIEYAAIHTDCKGFEKFMERLAEVVNDRGHTAQELLNFMEYADLPIADDGTIVAYKTLDYADGERDVWVDKHSGTVRQKLGTRVSMPLKDVDESRRIQCSTGLHIARRQYLRYYMGDVLTIVKVAPEDVVAVPERERDKMRAASYHIVGLLPEGARSLVGNGLPATTNKDAAKMIADVIAGNHVGVLEEVRIGDLKEDAKGRYDKEIEVEKKEDSESPPVIPGKNGEAVALDDVQAGIDVDIASLNQEVEAAQKEAKKSKPKKSKTQKSASPAKKSNDAEARREAAVKDVLSGGMSMRAAAKKHKVCAKTLSRRVQAAKAK